MGTVFAVVGGILGVMVLGEFLLSAWAGRATAKDLKERDGL